MATFADLAGIREAAHELEDVVAFLKASEKTRRVGGGTPGAVLIVGPPGTGKTHLARAVAGEARVPFFSITGSDVKMLVGLGVSQVRDVFEHARKHAPSVVFIDELDAFVSRCGEQQDEHDEGARTLAELLTQIDAFASTGGVILAATSRREVIAPALLRSGRLERCVELQPPDTRVRKEILLLKTAGLRLSPDVDLDALADETSGMVGRDLAALVKVAALGAACGGGETLSKADVERAKRKAFQSTRAVRRLVAFDQT